MVLLPQWPAAPTQLRLWINSSNPPRVHGILMYFSEPPEQRCQERYLTSKMAFFTENDALKYILLMELVTLLSSVVTEATE